MNHEFWDFIQQLVDGSHIVIDRPKGSTHPRYASKNYPVDYGYLQDTISIDLGGVDIWTGSLGQHVVTGVLLTVDLFKQDTELKIIYDCSEDEIESILNFINGDQMRGIYVKRER